jgi:hypothetical protein
MCLRCCRWLGRSAAELQMLAHKPVTALQAHAGIGVALHGAVKPGLWTVAPHPVGASHTLVTEQSAENEALRTTPGFRFAWHRTLESSGVLEAG